MNATAREDLLSAKKHVMISRTPPLQAGNVMYIPFDLLFIVAIFFFLSMRILKNDQRLVILRLGRFLRVAGPGLVWLIPVIDKGIKVNLERDFPGWQVLSSIELEEKIKASVLKNFQS